jgi:hypothetical protein
MKQLGDNLVLAIASYLKSQEAVLKNKHEGISIDKADRLKDFGHPE